MAREAIDYSWARPGGANIVAAGKTAVGRYLYPGSGKGLDAGELADLKAHGLDVWLIFEGDGQDVTTFARGVEDAHIAAQQAQGLGITNPVVYFAVDFNATSAQFSSIGNYFDGAASVLGKGNIGAYGSYKLLNYLKTTGHITYMYQTYAWSSGHVLTGVNIYQHLNGQSIAGGAVDFDTIFTDQFGQIGGGHAAPAPSTPVVLTPPPFPLPKGWYFGPESGPVNSVSGHHGHNADFAVWQERMHERGWVITVDGFYGPQSANVARAFQQQKGLHVDALVGPQTWAAAWTTPVT